MPTNNADDFNNPLAISQGGTNATSMATTDGVAYYDGTRLVVTDAGVAGQLLTSNGAGNAPTWQAGGSGAPSGQGWDLIQSQTFSGGTGILNFTTGITNTYNTYVVVYSHGGAAEMTMRYSTNGGSTYATTGYVSTASLRDLATGAAPASPDTSTSAAIINSGQGVSPAYGSIIYLFNVTSGLNCTMVGLGTNDRLFNMCYASLGNGAAINALRFIGVGISFATAATISLYGVNEA